MSDQHGHPRVERFHATNGRASGYLGLACAGVILVLAIVPLSPDRPLGVALVALLAGLLIWAVMLRPAMWATDRELVMRGVFHTDTIPLAAIDRVAVGQVTAVTVDDKRYISPVVGYTARQSIKQRNASRKPDAKVVSSADTYQVFVEERITHLAREAHERYAGAPGEVRRTLAWPEIVGTVVLLAAFLVWLLVL